MRLLPLLSLLFSALLFFRLLLDEAPFRVLAVEAIREEEAAIAAADDGRDDDEEEARFPSSESERWPAKEYLELLNGPAFSQLWKLIHDKEGCFGPVSYQS